MIVDSHCHLDYDGLAERLPEILDNARKAGVGALLSISTKVSRFPGLLSIAEKNPSVFCTVGTHPHHAHEELDVTVEQLVQLAAHPRVIGLGEAGLDYHYDLSPRAAQEQGFRTHIKAARVTGLPLVIHAREADDDVAKLLQDESAEGSFPFVLHCFTASWALAEAGLRLGGFISFSGILTYKTADALRDVARRVPAERLLVETDAPYLAPVPHRGRANEPAFVAETLKMLASVRCVSPEEMAWQTTENFFRLFSKAKGQMPIAA